MWHFSLNFWRLVFATPFKTPDGRTEFEALERPWMAKCVLRNGSRARSGLVPSPVPGGSRNLEILVFVFWPKNCCCCFCSCCSYCFCCCCGCCCCCYICFSAKRNVKREFKTTFDREDHKATEGTVETMQHYLSHFSSASILQIWLHMLWLLFVVWSYYYKHHPYLKFV